MGHFFRNTNYTVKKGYQFSRPKPGCNLPNSPWLGIILLFRLGTWKSLTFFYSVYVDEKTLILCSTQNKRQTMYSYEECFGCTYSKVELFSWALSQIWIFVRLPKGGSWNESVIKRVWFYELPFKWKPILFRKWQNKT